MTQNEKNKIIELRNQGKGYGEIAKELGLTKSAVRMFISRNALCASDKYCKNCGRKILQPPKVKTMIFCCSKCRDAWWNKNRDQSKTKHILVCTGCGCEFTSPKHPKQKQWARHCFDVYDQRSVKTDK